VKEFSKARLRKRAKSNILRQGPRRLARFPPGLGFNRPPPLLPALAGSDGEGADALFLIREEIAIMKKMNHPNLVQLIEVLDDPEEDSLYMVLEMCKKGVVMKVGLDEPADPYPEEACRHWFRDLILGIEYREQTPLSAPPLSRPCRVLTLPPQCTSKAWCTETSSPTTSC